ncbi:MAG: hypothetical protein NWQ53_12010 [Flavobacteriales bacterium]|nr:hypothetical protein [Flavobacteriales bacterium]
MKKNTFPSSIFVLSVLLSAFPILTNNFTPTVDGPAHLYNSQLLVQLLAHQNEFIGSHFALTPGLMPNWIGHFFLSTMMLILPAFFAEKLLLLMYLFGFAYGWRFLICAINKSNMYLTFFGLPFIYSFLFLMGFYNYCLSFILAFYLIGLSLSLFKQRTVKRVQQLMLLILPLALFFSHVFVFGITMFVLTTILVFYTWQFKMRRGQGTLDIFKFILPLFLGMFLSSSLFALHFFERPTTLDYTYIDREALTQWLWESRPLLVYNWRIEGPFLSYFTPTILAMFFIAFGYWIYKKQSNVSGSKRKTQSNTVGQMLVFLSILAVLLLLYFYLPDEDQLAGFVSVRLSMMILLTTIAFLAYFEVPKWSKTCSGIIVLYIHFGVLMHYSDELKRLGDCANEIHSNAKYIEENSSVLAINLTDDWLQAHFSNYLGVDKPMAILNNYEADMGYFPLKWNDQDLPQFQLANRSQHDYPEISWRENTVNEKTNINYVFVFGTKGKLSKETQGSLSNHFFLVNSTANTKLYRYME